MPGTDLTGMTKEELIADLRDVLREQERLHHFLWKINALTRYFCWRDLRQDPGVELPRSPPLAPVVFQDGDPWLPR
jgi:hypothetical protein